MPDLNQPPLWNGTYLLHRDNAHRQQDRIYFWSMIRALVWSLSSLIAAIAGLVLIIVGVIIWFNGGNIAIAGVTSLSGLLGEITPILFFQQQKEAWADITTIRKELTEQERLKSAMDVAISIDNKVLLGEIARKMAGLPESVQSPPIPVDNH